jgi:beta-glucosidase
MLNGYFSQWPEPLGLAATDDSLLVVEFGRIASAELRALGIRVALHPMADLATEPRWARINGTFGEDARLSAKMIAAYIYGFQGEHLDHNSVACMTKHWPGGGPQAQGWDAHFRYGKDQVYPGGNFNYHLIPFEAAFAAGTTMIMPYYGIPKDQTSENVGMSFNREIIQLLRNKYHFDGIICTDWGIIESFKFFGFTLFEGPGWGVDDLSPKQRIEKAIAAGIDQFGGNSNTDELVASVRDGTTTESRIDESVRRILKNKFELGLFDNPYVDVVAAKEIVGKSTFVEKGKIAQRKSVVLLKNSMKAQQVLLPLSQKPKVYFENVETEVAARYAEVVTSPEQAAFAILRLNAPFEKRDGNMMESFFHQGKLDFASDEIQRIQKVAKQIPTIICIYLDRPAVFPEINEVAAAVLGDFGASDDAVLDIVFGKYNPSAKLPFELPSSMQAVEDQKEDVPHDSENPLYSFGHGLTYAKDTL